MLIFKRIPDLKRQQFISLCSFFSSGLAIVTFYDSRFHLNRTFPRIFSRDPGECFSVRTKIASTRSTAKQNSLVVMVQP